jgi:signal transduction histidine kinase
MRLLKSPILKMFCTAPQQLIQLLFFSCLFYLSAPSFAQKKLGQTMLPSVRINDSTRLVDRLNQLALWYQPRQLDSCFFYVDSALKMATRLHYLGGKAMAYKVMGNYYTYTANKYLSYRFYLDAQQTYETLEDTVGYCTVLLQLGIYYKREGALSLAQQTQYAAMEMAGKLQNDSTYGLLLANYCYIYGGDSTKTDSLKWALAKARDILTRHHDEKTLLYIGLLEADAAFGHANIKTIQQQIDSIITVSLLRGYSYVAFYGCAQLAQFKGILKQPDSIQYYKKMVDLGIRGGYKGLLIPAVGLLHQYYVNQKIPARAYAYSGIMLDVLQYRQQTKMRGEIDYMAYFTQDQEMALLQMEYEGRQHMLETTSIKKNTIISSISFYALLLGVLLIITAYIYRSVKIAGKYALAVDLANKEMEVKNKLLTTNDDFKNMLISLIAHDFRLPLSNILDITTLLKAHSFTLEEAAALIVKVEGTAQNTLEIFDNILRWIRTQLSGFVYEPELCWLNGLINIARKGLEPLIMEKHIRLVIRIPADFQIYGNPQMLQFVHRNLLHNAIKFSPMGGEVVITAMRSNGMVKVCFTDQGSGIAPEILKDLFVFTNKKELCPKTGKGAGLALIICKDFISKMGGHIQAENNAEKGTTFWYSVPDNNN